MDDQGLRDYFKFDQTDLDANRSGKLSEKQLKQLIAENKTSNKIRIGAGIVSGLLFLALVASVPILLTPAGIATWQNGNRGGAIDFWVVAFVWALGWGGIGILKIFPLLFNRYKDKNKLTLRSVSGTVKLAGGGWTNSHGAVNIDHYMHIRKEKFLVDEDLDKCMKQGDSYTVYFVENKSGDQQILSVECLEPAGPEK